MYGGGLNEMSSIKSEHLRPQFLTIWVGLEWVALLEKFVTRGWLSFQKPHAIPTLQFVLSTFCLLSLMWVLK